MKILSLQSFFRLICAIAIVNATACASRPNDPPAAAMPATPEQFLIKTKFPSDQSLNCAQLLQELRYTLVLIESIDRVFDSKGPVLIQESSHSSTTGVAVRSGGLTTGYANTNTIGGNSVYVYSNLSYRAKQITDAQQSRRRELQYLIRANACTNGLKNSGPENYTHYIREAESDLRSSRRNHEDWIEAVRESQVRLARADTPEMRRLNAEDLSERIRLRDEFKNSANAAQVALDKIVAESKEAYARAQSSAIEMRKWFEVNTKIP